MVLESQPRLEITEWDPDRFSAPASMDDLAPKRQLITKPGTRERSSLFLECGLELKGPVVVRSDDTVQHQGEVVTLRSWIKHSSRSASRCPEAQT